MNLTPDTPRQAVSALCFRITAELFRMASVDRMLLETRGPSFTRIELRVCEAQMAYTIGRMHDDGIEAITPEWLREINRMAGVSASYAEDETKAEYYSGDPATYALIWNQVAYWSYNALEAARAA